ncbi:hypothetical protein P154DRAFT_527434 [Amniculicola lignicola CBS 123094]|uniref:Uncharacterized protein n=1 Tax=Amniculicola lignicola CBS 123094 TaxID=1392246 RepID=A0A6A5VYD6_9PLEO|nr:hypothetical protein P154DRAFT_527434 [Amniculicola lignicola CBS 123094]
MAAPSPLRSFVVCPRRIAHLPVHSGSLLTVHPSPARLLITSHCGVSAMALAAGMNRPRFPHEGCFTCRRLVDGRCQAPRLLPASRL